MNPDDPSRSRRSRILFCTDFSPGADEAFDWAVESARLRDPAELILLHVIPEPEAQFWKTYIYEVEDVDAKARRDVDEKIERTYAARVPDAMRFRPEVRVGNVSGEILDFARNNDVDLIVLGRQGHSALAELVFGSVADKILRGAPCPVVIVPRGRSEQ